MTGATNLVGDVVVPSKATSSSAPHKHQRCAQTKRGIARGVLSAHVPAAYEPQACELGRGDVSPVLSRILIGWSSPSRRPVRCPSRCSGHHLPGCAVLAAPGTLHSSRNRACKPFARNSLTAQQFSQCIADRVHSSRRLSSSLVSAGNNPNENGLTKWTSILCSRSKSQ